MAARTLRNKRNIAALVALCWIFAALLTIPAWIWRSIFYINLGNVGTTPEETNATNGDSGNETIPLIPYDNDEAIDLDMLNTTDSPGLISIPNENGSDFEVFTAQRN